MVRYKAAKGARIQSLSVRGIHFFGFGHLPCPCLGPTLVARNPIKFGHFQPFSCGFFDCIPESRDPIGPQLACGPRFARAAP